MSYFGVSRFRSFIDSIGVVWYCSVQATGFIHIGMKNWENILEMRNTLSSLSTVVTLSCFATCLKFSKGRST